MPFVAVVSPMLPAGAFFFVQERSAKRLRGWLVAIAVAAGVDARRSCNMAKAVSLRMVNFMLIEVVVEVVFDVIAFVVL